ncbi:MAG: type II secretion system protein GspG [Bdellovibrionales bacterium]|nr:type II secretion system protein GspG [Bdellovibrionales bacterium]
MKNQLPSQQLDRNRLRHNLINSERGLTLIEILVVLIILGILMSFLGGKIFGAGEEAKRKITETMMQEVKAKIDMYRLQYNTLPSSLEDLTRCNERTGPGCVPLTNDNNLRDAWGNLFAYSLENGGRAYEIKSYGANGREGGEGVDYDVTLKGP